MCVMSLFAFGYEATCDLKLQIVPGYVVTAEQSEFYNGCTNDSPIGLA